MKKKLMMVAVLLGALSLGACVDDNETQSVTDVRNAKAEQLQARADMNNAEAEAQKIQADAEAALMTAKAEAQKAAAAKVNAEAETIKKRTELVELQKEAAGLENDAAKIENKRKQVELETALANLEVTKKQAEKDLAELAARMEHGEHDFECGLALFFVEVGRDASAVILDCDRVVFVDRNVDVGTVSCQRLVDRVIHHLVNQVVQTFFSDVADIHGRTLPDRFQTFEDLDVGGGILLFLLLYLFSFSTHIDLKYIVQIYGKVS